MNYIKCIFLFLQMEGVNKKVRYNFCSINFCHSDTPGQKKPLAPEYIFEFSVAQFSVLYGYLSITV